MKNNFNLQDIFNHVTKNWASIPKLYLMNPSSPEREAEFWIELDHIVIPEQGHPHHLIHELVHSLQKRDRVPRTFELNKFHNPIEAYYKEEIVAYEVSFYVCQELGLPFQNRRFQSDETRLTISTRFVNSIPIKDIDRSLDFILKRL